MNQNYILFFYPAIFLVIYLFFIRPQQQKIKKEKSFLEEIQKGDKVILANGIHGTIDRVDDGTFMVEIDKNVKIRIEKSGISAELTQALKGKDSKESEKKA